MQRLSFALLLAIALVAGMTAETIVNRPGAPATYSGLAASSETARAFYDALNEALAGGSTEALAALLAPGFVDHDASIGEAQSAEAFLERIGVLGQMPGVAPLSVESIETSGSSLIVQVSQTDPGPRSIAGVSVEQVGNQGVLEVLRAERGRVGDRWTPGIQWLQATEVEAAALHSSGQSGLATSLMRIAIPVGEDNWWYTIGPGFFLIESGSARIHTTHEDGDEETLQLERGAAVPVAAGDRVQIRSANGETVTALVYALMGNDVAEVAPAVDATDARSRGVTQTMLWSGPFPHSEESAAHRLGTLMLPTGMEAKLTGVAGATLLLAIESGAIEIAAPGGAVSVLGEDLWVAAYANFAAIDARRAASIARAGAITLRNVSEHPVTIVLVVIRIAAQSGPPIG